MTPYGVAVRRRRQPLRRQRRQQHGEQGDARRGMPTTFATGFNDPVGLAFDAAGNLYVANNGADTVSEVTPAGGQPHLRHRARQLPPAWPSTRPATSTSPTALGRTVSMVTPGGGRHHLRLRAQPPRPGVRPGRQPLRRQRRNNTVSEVTPAARSPPSPPGSAAPTAWSSTRGNLYVANGSNNTVSQVTDTVTVPFTLGGTRSRASPYNGFTSGLLAFRRADHPGHHRDAPLRPRPQPDADLHPGHPHEGRPG